jgi:signal transduction histidine kinase
MRTARLTLFVAGLLLLLTQAGALFAESRRAAEAAVLERRDAETEARALMPRIREWVSAGAPGRRETADPWIAPFDHLVVFEGGASATAEIEARFLHPLEAILVSGTLTTSGSVHRFELRRGARSDAFLSRSFVFQHALILVAALAGLILTALPAGGERRPGEAASLVMYERAMTEIHAHGASRARELAHERARLEEVLRDREVLARASELTAGVVHEMRNSLGAIALRAQSVSCDSPGCAPARGAILKEAAHAEATVRRFMEFVQASEVRIAPFDLAATVREACGREGQRRADISIRAEGPEIRASGDSDLLARAFENIVRNAVDFSPDRGTIDVTWGVENGSAFVRVADRGPGFGDAPTIKPFVSKRPGGLGLGLPLALKILSLHGGRIDLAHRTNGGAVVECRWSQSGATDGNVSEEPARFR